MLILLCIEKHFVLVFEKCYMTKVIVVIIKLINRQ